MGKRAAEYGPIKTTRRTGGKGDGFPIPTGNPSGPYTMNFLYTVSSGSDSHLPTKEKGRPCTNDGADARLVVRLCASGAPVVRQ